MFMNENISTSYFPQWFTDPLKEAHDEIWYVPLDFILGQCHIAIPRRQWCSAVHTNEVSKYDGLQSEKDS